MTAQTDDGAGGGTKVYAGKMPLTIASGLPLSFLHPPFSESHTYYFQPDFLPLNIEH